MNLSRQDNNCFAPQLTKQGAGGSNAEGYARYHVDTHGWPGIGYHYCIEPDGTIKWCNDLELRTYHVGNHNNYCVGIVLTGDFRYEDPTKEQEDSLRRLVYALQKEYSSLKHIKGHHEFSGYEWKACQEFDYKKILNEKGSIPSQSSLPSTYKIQEGDTFWSIAKGMKDLSVDDLKKANPKVDPTKLRVGQVINLGKAKKYSGSGGSSNKSKKANLKVDGYWGTATTKALQKALGTVQDGVISNQSRNKVTAAIVSGITFGNGSSTVIRALQRKVGSKADGLLGPNTVRALQKHLGTPVDGKIGKASLMVTELQKSLIKNIF
ncbi:N-acetylmuramoyl-L-alanine amidase [Gracilibacillus sp. S3-1-1]|uniref:N-acetylmuramoyl-L-alanine amidase n=1 Tax=Gracilibacillus pellucidus TaxID=3095368 RepID=A0ACC6M1K6_9BACI|nr:N-acetylmuramoyl-L-alanine amidase [Gracilibacillus sp. S3-1-1]MDX8044765.1 N-acetylmuramoyl-L-alanine amidase [Gracilibacillus sp. S3-1-1]